MTSAFTMSDAQLWSNSGYTVNNPTAWAPPIIQPTATTPRYDGVNRGVKRSVSESEDCDDVFSEESSKDRCSSPNEDCQMGFSRKKRRGIIEKRRRDRINTSLSELRRLVPSAFEKQGSAKLEKAEILQMTVDHLKTLHSKGIDALAYDPHKFAMDYHNIGFRECAAEVARYLVTVEGMDIQDPLRLRLMSHLQCFAAQRELATKQASNTWTYNSYGGIPDYTPNSYEAGNQQQTMNPSHLPPPSNRLQNTQPELARHTQGQDLDRHPDSPSRHLGQTEGQRVQGYSTGHQYQGAFTQQGYNTSQGVKPYRPWGSEVAY